MYCNDALCKTSEVFPEYEIERKLIDAITVFNYLDSKDHFLSVSLICNHSKFLNRFSLDLSKETS